MPNPPGHVDPKSNELPHGLMWRLEFIILMLIRIYNQGVTIMADLTSLTAQVAQNTSVEGSALTLIQGIAAQLAAAIAANDPAAIQSLQDQLSASATALAAAIAANTPAAPTAR
jgi:hypothetical protein